MVPSTQEERLSWPERLKVVFLSLGFILVLSFVCWVLLTPMRDDRFRQDVWKYFWEDFWKPLDAHGSVRQGVAILTVLACHLIFVPLGFMVFLAGVVHGLRGRRTRLAAWILREMSQQEVRKRHDPNLYLSPAVGWGILLGFLALIVAALIWLATRET